MARLGPGILVAATGVGAGDLVNATLAGSKLGLSILWAAWVGALLKWFLNEGIARWQMATGTTLLTGWLDRLGNWIQILFVPYLLLWTLFVGGALIKACGVAGAALVPAVPVFWWGVIHSLVGLAMVLAGGFKTFEKLMSVCIGAMFCTVVSTALWLGADLSSLVAGLGWPRVPEGGLGLTLGVLGGVGGTVTLLSYGYWIDEEEREGVDGLKACRLDLSVGYAMTAVFGMAMVVIGSRVTLDGKGAQVAVVLADLLAGLLGEPGRYLFLVGFWAAVFSSLLGVWQGVPYLAADYFSRSRGLKISADDLTRTPTYRYYLLGLALLPLGLQSFSLKQIQVAYAVLGAMFMPLLAVTLLLMNNRRDWVGEFRNNWLTNLVLVGTLLFFAYQGVSELLTP